MIGAAGGAPRGVGRSGPVGPYGGDGTLRGMKGRVRGRWLRALAAAGAAGAVAAGTAACEPSSSYSNTSAIAVTTDRQGTRALEWESVDVRWLSCTASAPNGGRPAPTGTAAATPAASERARVDCQGETVSGERITIRGPVTREVNGRCVEGNELTAVVGGRVIFRTDTIGNCDAPATGASPGADNSGNPDNPGNSDDSGNPGNSDNPSNSDGSGNSDNPESGPARDDQGGGGDQNGGDHGDGHDDGKWQEDGKWQDDGSRDDGHQDDCPDGDHNGDHGDDGHGKDGKWQDDGKWHDGKDGHGDDHNGDHNGDQEDVHGTSAARQ